MTTVPPPPGELGAELARAVGEAHVETLGARRWRVTPSSAAEVAEIIERAAARRAAVHPVGAGALNATGERPPAAGAHLVTEDRTREQVLISTRRLDQVLQLDEQSLLVHAQVGLTGLELERILAPRGLSIGDYPPVVLTSSLGGILAVRTPGKSSARHGFFEDAVAGVSAVLANGRTVHTRVAPRRSTGPDLLRALCGSEGTIGFLTSAVLRIHQRPEARLVAAYVLPSIDAAVNAVYLALREEAAPSGLRIYDRAETAVHFDGLAIPAGHALLCAATAGPTDLAACDRDLITSAVLAEGGRVTDAALADLWWRRLHAGEPTPGAPPSLQVMATRSKLRAVYHAIAGIALPPDATIDRPADKLRATMRAHISRFDADGAILFVTLEGLPTAAGADAIADAERAAARAGGWLLGARADKLDAYFRSLRDTLDPHGILNPGVLE